jgi:uncharacterized membrane protein YraQ (UPF0718 family)
MLNQISSIAQFIVSAFIHIWPYLLVTIPLAVAVNMSGASKYINRAFQARPIVAILLATAVGAFSPFCSCGVIPVIAALLMGGVPLAPVMSFWIASPSMDPEIFFLSVSTIGWDLAVWRLAATLVLSLSAGFLTHLLMGRGWLGRQTLRQRHTVATRSTVAAHSTGELLRQGVQRVGTAISSALQWTVREPALATEAVCCNAAAVQTAWGNTQSTPIAFAPAPVQASDPDAECSDCQATAESNDGAVLSFRRRLLKETWIATAMVAKFMALAFFLEALINLYIPSEWIAGLLGQQNPWAILTAAFLGVPVYTSNLAALPMVSGLLAQGMNPAAALAFLVAGPTTTLPAMAAVWGLTTRRVFALYVSLSLLGAVLLGYFYSWVV